MKRHLNNSPHYFYQRNFRSSHPEVFLRKGVLEKRCSENMQQIYRRTPMPKCSFNKVTRHLFLITPVGGCFWNFRILQSLRWSTFDFTIFALFGAKPAVKFSVDSTFDLHTSPILGAVCNFISSLTAAMAFPREYSGVYI